MIRLVVSCAEIKHSIRLEISGPLVVSESESLSLKKNCSTLAVSIGRSQAKIEETE